MDFLLMSNFRMCPVSFTHTLPLKVNECMRINDSQVKKNTASFGKGSLNPLGGSKSISFPLNN